MLPAGFLLPYGSMFELIFFGGLLFVVSAVVIQCLPQSLRSLLPASSDEATLPPLYLWSVLLLVLAYNVFAYDAQSVAIGTGLFVSSIVLALFIALPRKKQTFFAYACAGIGVLAGVAFGFRANEFVQAVNAVTAALSVGGLLLVQAVDRIEWNAAWFLRTVAFYPAVVFQRLPGAARLLKPSKLSGMSMVLRVAGITVVLVIFFAAILSSADPIFAEKIHVLREEVVPRTLLSIVLACAFMLSFAATFSSSYTYKPLPLRFLSWIETAVPVGAVCVLFGVFLWVQGTYLFADHASFKALDLTYAEYVRKGMIELLVATFCAGLLSYVVSLKERELKGMRETGILRAVNAVLLVELFLMLASALKRDWLYMDVYGLTRVRVVGEIFLAWLACLVVLFAVFALWRRLNEKAVFAGAIAVSFCVVVYLNAFNMDAKIVMAAVPANQKIDTYYMSLLSVDAVDAWEGMIEDMVPEYEQLRVKETLTPDERTRLASLALGSQGLYRKRDAALWHDGDSPSDWRDWRWSDTHAVRVMSGSTVFGSTLDCLTREIADYRTVHKLALAEETSLLMNDYTRPFVTSDYWYDDFPYTAARPDPDGAQTCL